MFKRCGKLAAIPGRCLRTAFDCLVDLAVPCGLAHAQAHAALSVSRRRRIFSRCCLDCSPTTNGRPGSMWRLPSPPRQRWRHRLKTVRRSMCFCLRIWRCRRGLPNMALRPRGNSMTLRARHAGAVDAQPERARSAQHAVACLPSGSQRRYRQPAACTLWPRGDAGADQSRAAPAIQPKLRTAENIAQAAQFASTGQCRRRTHLPRHRRSPSRRRDITLQCRRMRTRRSCRAPSR